MKEEIWKDIPGYEGKYQASTYGRIKSLNYKRSGKEKILKTFINNSGYLILNLNNKTWLVHRLTALTFIENPKNYSIINHKDENKLNNKVENLEWTTSKYNANYGKRNKKVSLSRYKPIGQYDLQGNLIKTYPSPICAEKDGFKRHSIADVCRGHSKTHKGFIFKYL